MKKLWILWIVLLISSSISFGAEDTDYTSQFDFWFHVWEKEFDLPEELNKAVATHESLLDPNVVGCSGDLGLMQLNPRYIDSYLDDLGWVWEFDWEQPRDNIMLGSFILSQNLAYYDGDIEKALSAYNAGIGWTNKNGIKRSYVDNIEWEGLK